MLSLRLTLLVFIFLLAGVVPGAARAQTLTVYNSGGSYGTALPTTGLTTTIENFAGISANAPVSTTSPQSWRGFTLLAAGTSPWGPSQYCLSLASCLNWTTSPPASPGVYAAVGDPSMGSSASAYAEPAALQLAGGIVGAVPPDGASTALVNLAQISRKSGFKRPRAWIAADHRSNRDTIARRLRPFRLPLVRVRDSLLCQSQPYDALRIWRVRA